MNTTGQVVHTNSGAIFDLIKADAVERKASHDICLQRVVWWLKCGRCWSEKDYFSVSKDAAIALVASDSPFMTS
jgi:hypothetical protein